MPFSRADHLDRDDANEMAGWDHGGGLDASARIEANDRAGLERLLRYCARPPFAQERLEQVGDDRFVYRLPEPRPMAAPTVPHSPGANRGAGCALPA
jgi:hypothetical protein